MSGVLTGKARHRSMATMGLTISVAVVATLTSSPAAHAAQGNTYTGMSSSTAIQKALDEVPSWQPKANNKIKVGVVGHTGTVTAAGHTAQLQVVGGYGASTFRQHTDGVQALSVLRSPKDQAKFRLTLPQGVQLRKLGNAGSYAAVSRTGRVVGVIDAPWAVDATGKRLATSYVISGSRITQKVDTTGAAFPVVADPYFRWYWNGVVVTLSWADQLAVAQLGVSALIPMLVASGVGWTVIVPVLGAAGMAGYYAAHHQCFWFWLSYFVWGSSWGTYAC